MKIFNELKLAQELIKFQTIKTEDTGIMKFLSKKLSSLGFKCQIIKSKGTGAEPALNSVSYTHLTLPTTVIV